MAQLYGLQRTSPGEFNDRSAGWRLNVPVWTAQRRGYDVMTDEVVGGWWVLSIGLSIEPLGKHGVCLRLTWGWAPAWPEDR